MAAEHASSSQALLRSPLHERHEALGAKFSAFGGWTMPLEYPSGTVREHTAVREDVGIFDVSHLGTATVSGPGAAEHVNATLSNDLGRIGPGKAQYTLCLDEAGGIVDDLIVYYRDAENVLLVPNAANSGEVLRRVAEHAPEEVSVQDLHEQYAVIAVQGPRSDAVLSAAGLPVDHEFMSFVETELGGLDGDALDGTRLVVCRSGYTGERGCELIIENAGAGALWDRLMAAGEEHGIVPCGLGSRDTLRTEMGYPLHGQDLSTAVNPVEAGLSWAVGWDKPRFTGRDAVLRVKEEGPRRRLRGLVATGRGIPRPGMTVSLTPDVPLGEVTSGTFSPTLRTGVGLALLSTAVSLDAEVGVDVRGRRQVFRVTKPPFVHASVKES